MGSPRVLVTGATGFLGLYATAELRRRGDVVTLARTGADLCCDISDPVALQDAIARAGADFALHLAAMSRWATCVQDPPRARATNAAASGILAERFGSRLLYVSSDLVFDGRSAPYRALDPVAPLSDYGQSKAEGEELVLGHGGRVVRLPLLFGPDPRHRGATGMLRGAFEQGRKVSLYTNEYRTPLHCKDACPALADLLLDERGQRLSHLSGPERLSRWEFGLRFCAVHGLPTDALLAVECQDATRPRDVSLRGDWPSPRDLDAMLRDA